MWYKILKHAEEYATNDTYGYWLFADGTLLPVFAGDGHLAALKPYGMSTYTEAVRKNMVRLITDNQELWIEFAIVKPNSKQKAVLSDMAKNWNFRRFIIDSDYLPDDRYSFDNYLQFIRLINSIQ